ncbi:MAG: ribonuclease III, partial [Patescibacteria group bacterium]
REEGELTSIRAALVNYVMLARVAKEINLQKYILLSRGEAKDTGKAREVIMANALEALIGAIYLDQGYAKAEETLVQILFPKLDEVIEKGLYRDPKSLLQEIAQEEWRVTPNYKVITETGPDHQKRFVVGVYFGEELKEKGEGSSKQEAESDAAARLLEKLEKLEKLDIRK